jgi:electron transfer flavoprotein alpha/beta subunit
MNILLAFKAEPDLTMLAEQAWQEAESSELNLAWVGYQAGADEQAAAEIMLKQKQHNPELDLCALTIGDVQAEPFMRRLSASGFANLTRIVLQPECDLRFSPRKIASMLARWQRQNAHSLILTGSQSSEGNNSQTGFWLAEELGWPVLAGVVDFALDTENNQLEAQIIQGDERLTCRIELPAVLIVVNDGRYSLRVPGIRQKLAASKVEINCTEMSWGADEFTHTQLKRERHQRRGIKIEGETAQEKAQQLYDKFLQGRLPR